MKQRIWELDAARGLAVLGMVIVHFLFDLSELTGILRWREPVWFLLVKNHCGGIFLVISGISVTLGSHNIRRGIQVLLCGGLVTGVTYGMYALGLANGSIVIYFGVLQCLGVCMLLWSLLRRLPNRGLLAGGVTLSDSSADPQASAVETDGADAVAEAVNAEPDGWMPNNTLVFTEDGTISSIVRIWVP